MKRVNYDGRTLVTGDEVAQAIADYSVAVSRMGVGTAVTIPVLESDGSISEYTLLLTAATSLEIEPFERDPHAGDLEQERSRFPVPTFEPIGGKAEPMAPEDEDIRPNL